MTDRDPFVAFGLTALDLAMKAKAGMLERGEAEKLFLKWELTLAEDAAAGAAARAFAEDAPNDPFAAGEALLTWLHAWRAPVPRDTRHDWQRRADCGDD